MASSANLVDCKVVSMDFCDVTGIRFSFMSEETIASAVLIDKGMERVIVPVSLFLHVTCTRYFVSGHSDNCTLNDSVKRLPIKPPPATSQVTKHCVGIVNGSQATSTKTKESCCSIETVCNDQVSRMLLLNLGGGGLAHSSQHVKHSEFCWHMSSFVENFSKQPSRHCCTRMLDVVVEPDADAEAGTDAENEAADFCTCTGLLTANCAHRPMTAKRVTKNVDDVDDFVDFWGFVKLKKLIWLCIFVFNTFCCR